MFPLARLDVRPRSRRYVAIASVLAFSILTAWGAVPASPQGPPPGPGAIFDVYKNFTHMTESDSVPNDSILRDQHWGIRLEPFAPLSGVELRMTPRFACTSTNWGPGGIFGDCAYGQIYTWTPGVLEGFTIFGLSQARLPEGQGAQPGFSTQRSFDVMSFAKPGYQVMSFQIDIHQEFNAGISVDAMDWIGEWSADTQDVYALAVSATAKITRTRAGVLTVSDFPPPTGVFRITQRRLLTTWDVEPGDRIEGTVTYFVAPKRAGAEFKGFFTATGSTTISQFQGFYSEPVTLVLADPLLPQDSFEATLTTSSAPELLRRTMVSAQVGLLPPGTTQQTALTLPIDILPGQFPNTIAVGTPGTIAVGIISTTLPGGDAIGLDEASVRFVAPGGNAAPPIECHAADVDGRPPQDRVCTFDVAASGLVAGSSYGVLKARTADGADLEGRDSIVTTAAPDPRITVSPTSSSFGVTIPGSPVDRTFRIQNNGTGTLTVEPATVAGSASFTVIDPAALSVAPGATAYVAVRFQPTAFGAWTGTLLLASNDATKPLVQVPLQGIGITEGLPGPAGPPGAPGPAGSGLVPGSLLQMAEGYPAPEGYDFLGSYELKIDPPDLTGSRGRVKGAEKRLTVFVYRKQ